MYGALMASVIMTMAISMAWPRLLRTKRADSEARFVLPRGIVLVLAGLAAATFLTEGAVLNWSAILITNAKLVPVEQGDLAICCSRSR